ncbi:MAG: hypothetical protein ACT4PV_01235 [Planctomycetaceae bacterium]
MSETPPPAGASLMAVLALLGSLAIVAAFFLPWIGMTDEVRRELSLSRPDLERMEREVKAETGGERAGRATRLLLDGGSPNGLEWVAILGFVVRKADDQALAPRERRVFQVSLGSLRALPWIAGGLALLLLLLRLRPMAAPLLACLFAVGLVLGALGGLLWLGASQKAKEAAGQGELLGFGLKLLAGGGGAVFLASLFGVRATNWWKAYLLGLLLIAGMATAAVMYIRAV